jgi:hypothetical protein
MSKEVQHRQVRSSHRINPFESIQYSIESEYRNRQIKKLHARSKAINGVFFRIAPGTKLAVQYLWHQVLRIATNSNTELVTMTKKCNYLRV